MQDARSPDSGICVCVMDFLGFGVWGLITRGLHGVWERFAVPFDVLQMGGAAPPPTPALIFIAPHSQARPSSAEQETTCSRKTWQISARSDMFSSY